MNNHTPAFWFSSNNFGDALNYFLIKAISGKEPLFCERDIPHYVCCGSILSHANYLSTVWGAGFGKPEDIHSLGYANIKMVRGFETAKLLDREFDIVGDPALLMPMFYSPAKTNSHKVGVIPHWQDARLFIEKFPDCHFINPFQEVRSFIDDVTSCEIILSSSLHGLIIADAYGVPNIWVKTERTNEFKYNDYYSTVLDLVTECSTDSIDLSLANVKEYYKTKEELLSSCPFLK